MNRTNAHSNALPMIPGTSGGKGISAAYRAFLSKLHRFASGPITVEDATNILKLPRKREMKREIKFRAWDKKDKLMINGEYWLVIDTIGRVYEYNLGKLYDKTDNFELMQYTGLKDKNGLQEVYEGDIIDIYGNIKGNIYEMDKGKTDFVIQGFGDKNWGATYKEAMERGCKDT